MVALALRLALLSLVVLCACARTCKDWQARVNRKCAADASSEKCLKMKWKHCRADCLDDVTETSQYACAQKVGYTMDCSRLQEKWERKRCADADRKDNPRCTKLAGKFSDTGCPYNDNDDAISDAASAGDNIASDNAVNADAASDNSAPQTEEKVCPSDYRLEGGECVTVCPSDYRSEGGYCFKEIFDQDAWNSGICGDEPRHLAVIDNLQFATVLTTTYSRGEPFIAWVGGTSFRGQMMWADNQLMSNTESGVFDSNAPYVIKEAAAKPDEAYCAVFSSGEGKVLIDDCLGKDYGGFASICQVNLGLPLLGDLM